MSRVLIAEDDLVIAETFKEAIEASGHNVVAVAHNSEEAIDKAGTFHPDVALLDIRMDFRTAGIHASNMIKRRFPEIKVYFLTAYNKDIYRTELINAQYDGYIDKLKFLGNINEYIK